MPELINSQRLRCPAVSVLLPKIGALSATSNPATDPAQPSWVARESTSPFVVKELLVI